MIKKNLVLSLVILLTVGCSGHKKPSETYVKRVCVSEVSGATEDVMKHFSGVVKSESSISLGFKTAGEISQIYVKEGDRVKEGQLLATLDDSDYKLGVDALQIQYDQVSEEVSRARRLFEKKSMSANDFEKAEAGLKQLGIQLQVNKNKLAYTRLYAPTSGVIESVNFSPAEMVDAGTSVFTMFNTKDMEVVCDIPFQVYNERSRFMSFKCSPSGNEGEIYGLRLLNIVPKADGNQLYRMYLVLDGSASGKVTAGMNVEVTVELLPAEEGLSVPAKSVFYSEGNECVWVVNPDSTVNSRRIEIDKSHRGEMLRVTDGLTAGETVVRAGVSALHEGEKVKIVSAPSETNVGGLL